MKNKLPYFRFNSIQMTVLIPFAVLISVAVVILASVSIAQNRTMQAETSREYTGMLVEMVSNDIDSYISYMENLAQLAQNDTAVESFMGASDAEQAAELYLHSIEKQFKTLRETRDDINNIGVIGTDGRYFINSTETEINPNADYTRMDWYTAPLSGIKGEITSSHVQNIVHNEYEWVVTLSRSVVDPLKGDIRGVLFIDLNYSSISELCNHISLGTRGYVFVLDEDSSVVYHPKQQLLYSGILDEQIDQIMETSQGGVTHFMSEDGAKLYTVKRSKETGWYVVGVTYMEELLERSRNARRFNVLLTIMVIITAIAVSVYVSHAITRPITTLRSAMLEVEKGDLSVQMEEPQAGSEIKDLVSSFNTMVNRIRNLVRKNAEDEKEKRKSELRALQAQINPHFLYNTLDSIIWMGESGKNREVVSMTSALSKLLRKSISNEKEIVTVKEEVDYVSEYLKIQQLRYHDKLSYEIDVDESVLSNSIAKLVLQPLVENAIYHGIKVKEGMGHIRISGERAGGDIRLVVRDDGPGMDEEALSHILDGSREGGISKVGVKNVNDRLKLHYGEEYGLSFESKKGTGMKVTVTIPKDAGPEQIGS